MRPPVRNSTPAETRLASFLHQAGIAVAGGRVIFGTFDGTIYCFGLE